MATLRNQPNRVRFKPSKPSGSLVRVALCCLLVFDVLGAIGPGVSEYDIKAAFLYNFGKFVTWPAKTFADIHSPLVIGVWGGNVFQDHLQKLISGKAIEGHPLVFKEVKSLSEAKACQVLFISHPDAGDWPGMAAALDGAHVLTVSENLAHFKQTGLIINFVKVQDHIRFAINRAAADQAGLEVSSKLLSLAMPPSP